MAGITTHYAPGVRGAVLRHNYPEFSRQVLTGAAMTAEMLRRAELGAEYARSVAPVRTGEYRDSITPSTRVRPSTGRDHGLLVVGVVEAGTDHSRDIEWGSHGRPGHRVLGKALSVMASA